MRYAIQAVGFANGVDCPHRGQWLVAFDHDAYEGRGLGKFSLDVHKAMIFASRGDALAFWARQSSVKPIREDGRPNKPLTALTIEVVRLDRLLQGGDADV